MKNEIEKLLEGALSEIKAAGRSHIDEIKSKYLGKTGIITEKLRSLSALIIEERKAAGSLINAAKNVIEQEIEKKKSDLEKAILEEKISAQKEDFSSAFYFPFEKGHLHPIMKTIEDISLIFTQIGFSVAKGPEIETDWYNFEALNHPPDHPARDIQDTFYLEGMQTLLRTHTSPGQIHVMESQSPPVQVIVPGRVYRNEASDASHSSTFHQIEGLFVDEDVSFADLKAALSIFVAKFFGEKIGMRFRPSFFPFTEPSAEVDIECFFCGSKGCPVCKHSGWIEILGCGMVHPNVLKAVKYDSEKYTGFAFGMGVERIAMLKYGINDIRFFYENDLRFLKQF
jgi:phenylalanyl-tRNA synthetase alpha chain